MNVLLIKLRGKGYYSNRLVKFIEHFVKEVDLITSCISIEGKRKIHNTIRGINGYDIAVKTLEIIKNLRYTNVENVISTTILKLNQKIKHLNHIRKLAESLNCEYDFRIADVSNVYYKNSKNQKYFSLTKKSKMEIIKFIIKYKKDNPFLDILKNYLLTRKVELIGNRKNGIKCRTGEISMFIDAYGQIRPCIYSNRIIGTLKKKFNPVKIQDLGNNEPCPCCTECQIYPILNTIKNEE